GRQYDGRLKEPHIRVSERVLNRLTLGSPAALLKSSEAERFNGVPIEQFRIFSRRESCRSTRSASGARTLLSQHSLANASEADESTDGIFCRLFQTTVEQGTPRHGCRRTARRMRALPLTHRERGGAARLRA